MNKEYNITGKVDKKNSKLLNRIVELRGLGLAWNDISFLVKRSKKRVQEIYKQDKENIKA